MGYRFDHDLEFLKSANNEDLGVLVKYLTTDTDGQTRYTEQLTGNKLYKSYSPNHQKYWSVVAEELQRFGGNTFVNLFRGEGVLYREILTDVCDKLDVTYNSSNSTEVIELNLLLKILTEAVGKMSADDLTELAREISNISPDDIKEQIKELFAKNSSIPKEAFIVILQILMKQGGFATYQFAVILANIIAKLFFKTALPFAAYTGLTKAISIFTGPIGLVITGLLTAIDIAGPAYRVTIPCVVQIAYMRQKKGEAFQTAITI